MNSSKAKLNLNNSQPRYPKLVLHNSKFKLFLHCASKSIFFQLSLVSAILLATAKTAQGQTAVTNIFTHKENAAVTNYTTGTTVAPTSSNNYTWGGTNGNLILDGVNVGGNNFAATRFADQINLKRVNNPNHSGNVNFIWAEDANPTISGNPYNLSPAYPGSNMENALFGNIINRGSDNIFNNGADAGNNIERIDYIFSSGIKVVSPTTQGFVVLERGGNDPFKIAGIKTLSGSNPATYGSNLVPATTWGGSIPIVTDTLKDPPPPSGSLPFLPFRSDIGSQEIKGIFISFANLGFVAGDTIYGYSLVGNDATTTCLTNPNVCPLDTTDATGGGMDFISGGGVFSIADFGDAPDTYGTDSSNDSGEGFGASHTIVNTLKLGATAPDSEIDAQTPLNGTGDGADEDGISTLPSLDTSSASYSLTTTVSNTTGSAANVYSWIDFDRDGKFDEDERATVSNGSITLDSNGKVPTSSNGTVTLTWNNIGSTGANIIDGNSYLRVRLTTDNLNLTTETTTRDDASIGIASNGEIEDYAIAIAKSLDYGDAPDTYGTDNTANNSSNDPIGASHTIISGLFLGAIRPDKETNGFVDGTDNNNGNAIDDDAPMGTGTGNGDDEDNFTLPTLTTGDTSYTIPLGNITVTNSTAQPATLHAWIDFNKNGKFDSTEYASAAVNPSTNGGHPTANLTWSNINVGASGDTYARFRLTSDSSINNTTPGGTANNGEVEDYKIAISKPYDYGDAPDSFGDAGHEIPVLPATSTVYLGSIKPDKELDTQLGNDAGVAAAGDDGNGTPDDEDAFATLTNVPTVGNYNLTVPVHNTSVNPATLHAWIDFNQNNKFEAGEHQSATVAINATSANLNWTVPVGTTSGNTHVRFRLTTNTLTDNLTTTNQDERSIGIASNGEVEDYLVSISVPIYDYGDAPDTSNVTGTDNYQTTASHGGAAQVVINALGQVFSLGSNIDIDDGSLQNSTADADDTNGTSDDEDGVSSFSTLTTLANQTYTVPVSVRNSVLPAFLVGYIDFNKDGDFNDTGEKSATVTISNVSSTARSFNVTFTTPAGMTTGNTYARFRLGSILATTESATGASTGTDYGEIEDYRIAIAQASDYGDAPDTYGTNSTNNNGEGVGANHIIVNTLKLGTNLPDAETDAQTPLDGTGDGADEDGITTFPSLFNSNTSYSLTATVSNTTGSAANVYSWIDFDHDGKFDGDERATVSNGSITLDSNGKVPTGSNGTVTLTWNNLGGTGANITDGNSYARIRLTTDNLTAATSTTTRDLASVGAATNGEVEDYAITISKGNPNLPSDFCQASSRNLLFILDDSSSVTDTEVQRQRDAVMATLNDFVSKNLTGQAAIVGFDGVGRTVINYTNITAANLATFQTALNTNYGVPGGGTNWEAGFQAGTALGVNQPDVVFFFTDGAQTSGGSPTDEATQFKNAGAHIYGIGVDGLTIDSGFKPITDGDNTAAYNGSNVLEADFLPITDYSTLQNQFTNAFLANLCPADFGDAPDTYGTDNIVDNNSSTNPLGANHAIVSGLFLGTTAPDADANGFVDGIEDNSNATDDDALTGTGTGNGDDENNFTLPTLTAGDTSYTIPANNITATNTTTQSATLHAWIDFNKDGKFELIEYASATVNQGTTGGNPAANLTWSGISVGTVGNTYVRLRLTSDSSINNTTPGNAASNGEVEDYQIAIAQPVASNPKLLLVKRITAINPGQPDDEIQFNNFVDDATLNDNNSNWPDSNSDPSINKYLRGAINVPDIKPGDEVEYTIYFLSNGDADAKNVNICDVVPDNMTFNKNSYGTEVGIGLGLNTTNPADSINIYLSNFIKNPINNHQGNFYPPGTNPPLNLCKKHDPNDTDNLIPHTLIPVNDSSNNLSGIVLIKLNTPLPPATAPGTPANSYGFIRFRAKVK